MTSTNPQPGAEAVQVEQVDREAAARLYAEQSGGATLIVKDFPRGLYDQHSFCQAFARHRASAHAAGRLEGEREAVERCAQLAEDRMPAIQCMSVEPIVAACQDIADRIRASHPERRSENG